MFSDIIITKDFEGKKLKDYLLKVLKISRRALISLKTSNGIKINGVVEKVNRILSAGDLLSLEFPVSYNENIELEDFELEIIYEDQWIIVINKKAGVPVHPCRNYQSGTLANALMRRFHDRDERSGIHAITRLDKDTSGITLFAKHPHVQNLFAQENYRCTLKKKYFAIIEGVIEPNQGIIDLPIGRLVEGKIKRGVIEIGSPSKTGYSIIKSEKNISLVEVDLFTGRTHQIRAHFSHIGHPLLGDSMYGGNMGKISRQALHAFNLSFVHPIKNELIELSSQLPEDMKEIVNSL